MVAMNVGSAKWSTACALLFAAALPCAPSASADQTDDAFIAALDKNGITMSDPNAAISRGRVMCAALDKGQDSSVLLMKLIKDTNLSAKQAGFFVGVSVVSYCPQYKGTLDPSLNWLIPPPLM